MVSGRELHGRRCAADELPSMVISAPAGSDLITTADGSTCCGPAGNAAEGAGIGSLIVDGVLVSDAATG